MQVLVRSLLVAAMLFAPAAAAAQVACGEVLDRRTITLSSDLDCTGQPGAALTLRSSTLKMNGFTVRGGEGIKCADRCTIAGPGTIENSSASGIWSDLDPGTRYRIRYVTVRNNAAFGIAGFLGVVASESEIHLHASTVEANGLTGVFGDEKVLVGGSVIRGNGTTPNGGAGVQAASGIARIGKSLVEANRGPGVVALKDVGVADTRIIGNDAGGVVAGEGCLDPRGDAKVVRSLVTGNAAPGCGPGECADVASCGRPRVVRSTCDTSHRIASGAPGDDWNVCSLD